MKVGRRLATKLLNASKFVLGFPEPADDAEITEALDRAMLATVDDVVRQATSALEDFEYTTALERTERFFWVFCDDYVELVKQRAYDEEGGTATQSARLALRTALSTLLRLFAPFLPYSAEEAWSWWHTASVHTSPWPTPVSSASQGADVISLASTAISAIRRAKSDAKRSMRAPVETVRVHGRADQLAAVNAINVDLRAAGNVNVLLLEPTSDQDLSIEVTLAEE
jgi:valyl-tRNA synthetase